LPAAFQGPVHIIFLGAAGKRRINHCLAERVVFFFRESFRLQEMRFSSSIIPGAAFV
jgi:hypothetical protein